MSQHSVEVVQIPALRPHPNADSLALVDIYGFQVVINKNDFHEGDLAVYVEPDYVVDTTMPQFAFLGTHRRIGVRRFRNEWSHGLLVKAPEGAKVGDDVMNLWGIGRFEPLMDGAQTGGEPVGGPPGLVVPVYDVENLRRWMNVFQPNEPVFITEKVHGCNGRFVYKDGQFYCGSRREWKAHDPNNLWWKVFYSNAALREWCFDNPGKVMYGEVYGFNVQDLTYNVEPGEVKFVVFDILSEGRWLDRNDFLHSAAYLYTAPCLEVGPMPDMARLQELAEQDSEVASWHGEEIHPLAQLSEGIVIRPVVERTDPRLGRVILKLVSNRYLERS